MLRKLLYSLSINFFFLALCLIFGDLKFGAIDDYFMAARASGALGNAPEPLLLFVNAIYGYALLPLYKLFPSFGWYYIGEMASVFISFVTISYILISKMGAKIGVLLSALFSALFAKDFYLTLQFTQCASLLSAAGMLTFVHSAFPQNATENFSNKKSILAIIYAIFLMLFGSVMRYQAFLMGMPFFALALLLQFKKAWPYKWRIIISITVLFIGAFSLKHFDRQLYNNESYHAYNIFQEPRVILGDHGNYNKNAVYEDLEEVGKSGKDFHMLTSWTFYDTEVFHVDSLKEITNFIEPYRFKNEHALIPQSLLSALQHSLTAPLFWAWFVFCLIIFRTNPKKSIYLWSSLFIVFGLMTYLLFMGRLVYRVESGFWLYAACLAVPFFKTFKYKPSKLAVSTLLVAFALFNLALFSAEGHLVRDPSTGKSRTIAVEDSTDYKQVFDYIESNPDKMFLLDMGAYMRFSHHRNPPYLAEPVGSFRNLISFGYWTPYLPEITKNLNDYGIQNPIKDVVKENVIVINEGKLEDFLERHHYKDVELDTLKVIGEMEFFKYRLVEE